MSHPSATCCRLWSWGIVALCVLLTAGTLSNAQEDLAPERPPPKAPVPAQAGQQKLLDTLDEIYELQKKRTDEEMGKLIREILDSADETRGKPADRFVLLRKAMELAAEAGDAALTLEVIDRIAAGFQIDPMITKGKMLRTIASKANTADRIASLVEASNGYIDQAVAQKRFDYALSIATTVYRATQSVQGKDFRKDALQRQREVQKLQADHKKLAEALRAAEANPADAEANLTVGQLYCFSYGDWQRGLSYLAKGSDPTLAGLARRELAAPQESTDQVKLGDTWWNLAEGKKDNDKEVMMRRAGFWYEKAQSGPNIGLTKVKIEKRLAEIAKIRLPAGGTPRPAGGLTSTLKKGLVLHYSFDKDEGEKVTDKSEKENHGKANGTQWVDGARGQKDAACAFGGKGWIDAGSRETLKMDEAVTVAAWFLPVAFSSYQNIVSDHAGGGCNGKILRLQKNRIEFMMGPEGSPDVGCDLPAPGKWHHVVATYDGTAMRLYLDGAGVDARPHKCKIPKNPNPLLVGKSGFREHFRGLIDEVMVYDRALTEKEVKQLYRAQGGK